jgi:hypothetical protein
MSQMGLTERTPKAAIAITIDEQTSPPPSYDSASPRLDETDNESDNDDASTPVLGDDEDSASGGKNGALIGSKQKWNTVPDDKKRALVRCYFIAFIVPFTDGIRSSISRRIIERFGVSIYTRTSAGLQAATRFNILLHPICTVCTNTE